MASPNDAFSILPVPPRNTNTSIPVPPPPQSTVPFSPPQIISSNSSQAAVPPPTPSRTYGFTTVMVGFGVSSNLVSWGTPSARYKFGHGIFELNPEASYHQIVEYLNTHLRQRDPNLFGPISSNFSIKELMVVWGPANGVDLKRTIMHPGNVAMVFKLMEKREVDTISAMCGI